MTKVSWVDVLHYGSAVLLAVLSIATDLGMQLPGVSVDSKVTWIAAAGILGAGLKSSPLSGK